MPLAPVADILPDPAFLLRLSADPYAVRDGLARIASCGPMAALSPDHRATAEIVLAEVLNNIAEHAYAGQAGEISVALARSPEGLDCWTVDHGREMPNGKPPAGTLPEEEHPEGGFGWYLIRSLTQGLDYQRQDGENRLHFLIPV